MKYNEMTNQFQNLLSVHDIDLLQIFQFVTYQISKEPRCLISTLFIFILIIFLFLSSSTLEY